METTNDDINARLAVRLRNLRAERGLTLEALAERAGVSRSMISLVERGESSPTAAVLDRLAAGLGVTLASLFADGAHADASPLSRRADQATWRDPETGYLRRNLSPAGFPSPIELAEIILPAGARVAYDTPGTRAVAISQQVWVMEGGIELSVGGDTHALDAGDCLAMRLEGPIAFRNPTRREARYVVALAADQPSGGTKAHHLRSAP
ncbi:helix-turn-helix domain-containing protein [Longimicrobium terrae]|uniref:Transcriptional regulator with XRE-family HTH domain n=1 Tax=Longimicrobium terrae TaxID=1639882 RepID=A0A841H278_9BACT|nr:XRE family transcriptional regulator [Longimicrobium terrae]MBB4637582.1 transcriptional regulator with XRE-family HTH domain [Longimicrobium terrae]MBB6071979.1 transcriptional regulator with XRE-family HTH domain [Longimicrobium terrae]NNC30523.1 helix-turn-helix transcriptional regulator [Longimicrobium terrae]